MLTARFQVTGYEPRQIDGLPADWFDLLTFAKTFTGGIVGEATTVFMSAGVEGTRSYVATERIIGHLEADPDTNGSVTVQHGGLESDPGSVFGHVVPKTGTGCFSDWTGRALIRHDELGAYFEFMSGE